MADDETFKFEMGNADFAALAAEQHKLAAVLAALRGERRERKPVASSDPKKLYNDISLGAVLVARGLVAGDAAALDGLLSSSVEEFSARLTFASEKAGNKTVGAVLVRVLDADHTVLTGKGRFAEWRRKYRDYMVAFAEWMSIDPEERRLGKWRTLPLTARQAALIRATAELRQIEMPALASRGAAHDWLMTSQANLRYRTVIV
jgi:hypothetical protein